MEGKKICQLEELQLQHTQKMKAGSFQVGQLLLLLLP